jgi:lysophospholipase L1-like esterase
MHLRIGALFAAVLASLGPWVVNPTASAASPALPSSMAALGDSITQARNVCCSYAEHPGQSWSTGYIWYDGITSHYERIKRVNSSISGRDHNDSQSGAKMAAASTQAKVAVEQRVDYVTILFGANDLCTSSPATMTSPQDFRSQFKSAMETLQQLPQGAHVFVSSIPDIYHLWKVLHTNPIARQVWQQARICPSMLGAANTEKQRQQVVTREKKFNQILADVCGRYPNCRWDRNATYNYKFSPSQVSILDFFHPSLTGQAALADVTWAASWWPTT